MGQARIDRFGASVRAVRVSLGLRQRELARRIGRTQSRLSLIERGRILGLSIAEAEAICEALGATFVLGIEAPVLVAGPRQRDAAHARCVAYVARRLARDGWIVQREVPVGTPGRPGWIDVLAFNPETRVLLVIEVKTELVDFGGLERQLGWYVREARRAARRYAWVPISVEPVALLLATQLNDERVRDNGASIHQAFPRRWRDLMRVIRGENPGGVAWAIAFVDPRSRARDWCRPTILDGRRSSPPYRNIADFLRATR